MGQFFGRDKELKQLKELLKKRSASFVVIRGRRRIGKSRLIKEFGQSIPCYLFSGLPPRKNTTRQSQIDAFAKQMATLFQAPFFKASSWHDLFWQLGKFTPKGPVLLGLDEISWIGSKDPDFLGHLKNAWDLYFSQNSKLILIVCGSVSNWIYKNILSSTGFVGRISCDLELQELPIYEACHFWGNCFKRTSPAEIFTTLCVTGGVPRYLEEIMPEHSASQNIRNLCFHKEGLLYREFDQIFSDLFAKKARLYREIILILSQGSRNLNDISHSLGIHKSGVLSDYIKDLVHAGFVSEDGTWRLTNHQPSNLKKFRLSDNYLRFYLRYILPNKNKISKGLFELRSFTSLPGWETNLGLQFENLVMNNPDIIFHHLGLGRQDIIMYGPYFQRKTKRQKGCQVDLLIQTHPKTLYLCEVKFRNTQIGVGVVDEMKERALRLLTPKGFSKRLVLIHINGVTQKVSDSQDLDVIDFSKALSQTR